MAETMFETLRAIVQAVNNAPDLQRALEEIVSRVRAAMGVDAASVYFHDGQSDELVLMATEGLNKDCIGQIRVKSGEGLVGLVVERAEPVNIEDGPAHPRYKRITETGEQAFHGFLGVPLIQHRKVLGVLVVRQYAKRRFAPNDEAFLLTLAAQLAGAISHAGMSGEIGKLIHEVSDDTAFTLSGVAGAPGMGIGRAMVVYPLANLAAIPDKPIDAGQVEDEELTFRAAVSAVEADMRDFSERMQSVLPAEDLALFDALAMMLTSDTMLDATIARIRAGNWAPGALRETIADHVRIFEEMEDSYLRERSADIRDLGQRILTHIQSERPASREATGPTILVGAEIGAAHLAEIPTEFLAGVVSATGSSSSHVAILAHALGIPAVMGVGDLPTARLDDQEMVIDGYRGRVYVKPSAAMMVEFQRLVDEEAELNAGLEKLTDLPSETLDGHRVPLYVNTGLLSDISPSLRSGAEGVGLYRTEIPFLVRDGFPGEQEQRRIYREVLEGFAPRPVVLRTLDVGGDKPLPYFPITEDNPFLGWRGIRLMLDHPEIFLTQLRAIISANHGLGNLRLMLPMISDVGEVEEALQLIRRAHQELHEDGEFVDMPSVGVMIEVPSAVYQMEALAERVDFFSVGTNDLTQYLLAVDRNNARVAELYDCLHPAVLRSLQQIIDQAHAADRPVSVCGEMAGDPVAALLLLGMGVDSLSMSVGSLPRIKWVVRSITREEAADLAEQALRMHKVTAIKAMVRSALDQAGLGGLIRAGK